MIKVWYTPIISDAPLSATGGDLRVFRAKDIIERMLRLQKEENLLAAWALIEAMESELEKVTANEQAPSTVHRTELPSV